MPRQRARRDLPLAHRLLAPTPPPAPSSPTTSKHPTEPLPPLLDLFPHPLPSSHPSPFASGEEATLADLHTRIYHLIALALRAYIQQWYGRISPRDTTLLPAINGHIVVPIARHLLNLDRGRVHVLLLTHLPTLGATHVRTLASAQAALSAGFTSNVGEAYHARLPLRSVALAPPTASSPSIVEENALDPTYLTALADALLASALPKAEYEADVERMIVREVIARAVLGGVGKRLAAPWFWAELFLKVLNKPMDSPPPSPLPQPKTIPARLGTQAAHALDALITTWTRLLATITLLWNGAIFLVAAWTGAPPATHSHVLDPWLELVRALALYLSPVPPLQLRLALGALDALAALLHPVADRLAPYLLDLVLTPSTGVKIVALLERVLFPDGWPGPPPVEPTREEAKALDAQLRAVLSRRVRLGALGLDAARGVDVLADAGCNAHLVGMVLDAGVLALLPELGVSTEHSEAEKGGVQALEKEKGALETPALEQRPVTPEITVAEAE